MKTTTTIIISVLILVLVNAGARAQSSASELKIANPFRENLSISFNAPENGAGIIRMQSVTGQSVASRNIFLSRGDNSVQIASLGGLSKGIYVAQVVVKGVVVDNQKVIIY